MEPIQITDLKAAQTARDGHSLCWSCRSEVGEEPVCPSCVKLQPLGSNSDYFSVMGLPRKLNLDPQVLEPVFHALSRRFHPDMYRGSSPRERVIALDNSALLNQAYRTLRDPFERAAYLLQLEEGRATGSATGARDAPPQELLEEILEVQELLGDFKFSDEEERAGLRDQLRQRRDHLQTEQDARARSLTGDLFTRWDMLIEKRVVPADRRPLLDQIRRLLGDRAYLRRVLASLNEALTGPA